MDLVAAVREHPQLGVGSCHPWDECMTDEELAAHFRECDITAIDEAVSLGLAVLDVWDDHIAAGDW